MKKRQNVETKNAFTPRIKIREESYRKYYYSNRNFCSAMT